MRKAMLISKRNSFRRSERFCVIWYSIQSARFEWWTFYLVCGLIHAYGTKWFRLNFPLLHDTPPKMPDIFHTQIWTPLYTNKNTIFDWFIDILLRHNCVDRMDCVNHAYTKITRWLCITNNWNENNSKPKTELTETQTNFSDWNLYAKQKAPASMSPAHQRQYVASMSPGQTESLPSSQVIIQKSCLVPHKLIATNQPKTI